jgi:two-component system, NtrC family, nitrogen regulation response regulator NtrX
MKPSIIIIDDEQNICQSLLGILEPEGYDALAVPSGEDGLEALLRRRFDLALLDIMLPGIDGLETLSRIKAIRPNCQVVIISGHGTIETAVRATKLGAFDFMEKPLSMEKTLLVIKNALHQKKLEEENLQLREEMEKGCVMIGDSIPMQALRQQIDFAAPTDARILIYGENGTGKELVARLLHYRSHRRNNRFVAVNCAAIPEELIESELFGHVKGSFTGANEDKDGKFALADGGTLFLDEIGDMSLRTQSKILRVLEELQIEAVGGKSSQKVDVRVISATNKNLDDEIEKGNFREDLLFRLEVVPFLVPPLRERIEDIETLAVFFAREFCDKYGKPHVTFTPQAIEILQQYSWPGNVRELRNLVERVVIMIPRTTIDLYDLPQYTLQNSPVSPQEETAGEESLKAAREGFERDLILRRIKECGGNISHTARSLGIERSYLYEKMRRLDIPTPKKEA